MPFQQQMPMQLQHAAYPQPMLHPAMTATPMPFPAVHTGAMMPELIAPMPMPHMAAAFDPTGMMPHPMMMQHPLTARDTLSNLQSLNAKHCAGCGDRI